MSTVQLFWGNLLESLRLSDEVKAVLPQATIEYLTTVGLPLDSRLRAIRALNIEFLPDQINLIDFEGSRYVTIGRKFFADLVYIIAIKVGSGEIFFLFKRHESPYDTAVDFFNTSIQQLLECIITYIEWISKVQAIYKNWGEEHPHESREEAIQRRKVLRNQMDEQIEIMTNELQRIDALALAVEHNFWNYKIADLYLL